jgi:hypothetical protein
MLYLNGSYPCFDLGLSRLETRYHFWVLLLDSPDSERLVGVETEVVVVPNGEEGVV